MHKKGQVESADNINFHPNRYKDAGAAVQNVIKRYKAGKMGTELDFAPAAQYQGKARGYYLKKIWYYAQQADAYYSASQIQSVYQSIDYYSKKQFEKDKNSK